MSWMGEMTLFGAGNNATPTPPQPKSLFGYDVIDLIGEGAGSLIYAVSDPRDNHLYALKHVTRKNDKEIRFLEQLEAEHEVGQRVRSPLLRRTHDLKINKNLLFKVTDAALIMELFDGRMLEFVRPPTTLRQIADFIQATVATDQLQALGYVHCDLKPINIMPDDQGKVTVIQSGLPAGYATEKSPIPGTPDF